MDSYVDSDVNDEGWTDPFEVGISKNPLLETAEEKKKADAGLAIKYKLVKPAAADLADLTKNIEYKWVEIKNVANVVGFIKYKGAAVIHFDDTVSTAKDKKDLFFAQEVEAKIPRCLFVEFAKLGEAQGNGVDPPGRVRVVGPPLIQYDRGHLIRKAWGGINDLRNIVSMRSTVNQGGGDYFRIETEVTNTINALQNSLDYVTFKSTVLYDPNTIKYFDSVAKPVKSASIAELFGASTITGVQVTADSVQHADKVKIRPVGFDVIATKVVVSGNTNVFVDRQGNNPTPAGKNPLFFGPKVQNP